MATTTTPEFYTAVGVWTNYTNQNFGLSLQYPEGWNLNESNKGNLAIIDNFKPNDLPGRGGISDGGIKIDIYYLMNTDLNQAINCDEKIETTIECKDVIINGTTFRKRVVNSDIEGKHQEIILAAKTGKGIIEAVGFVPVGTKQVANIQVVEKIFGTFNLK